MEDLHLTAMPADNRPNAKMRRWTLAFMAVGHSKAIRVWAYNRHHAILHLVCEHCSRELVEWGGPAGTPCATEVAITRYRRKPKRPKGRRR
jgi:hypothetical protein